ncbi:MAG TPA: hypothetical protein VHX60_13860 [Acidobacteriaceae bacterium]|jgi:hypothetical protein|nr:hypothetical protein [Acidobacteriaceae bacterium]
MKEFQVRSRQTAHQRSIEASGSRRLLTRLRRYWNRWDHIQRGELIAKLKSQGCSLRGLAQAIGNVSPATLSKYIRLASLPIEDREALRHGETEKRMVAKMAAAETARKAKQRIEEEKRGRHSTALADIVLDFFRSEHANIHPSGIPTILQGVRDIVRGHLPRVRPVRVDLKARMSRAELFQSTTPSPAWFGDHEEQLGLIQRWLANVVVSVAPEMEIRERAMNKVEDRWTELVPSLKEQQKTLDAHRLLLYEGPHTQN